MVERPPAILIADEDPPTCDLLCDILTEEGYACYSTHSRDEVMSRLKEDGLDVALLGVGLSVASGEGPIIHLDAFAKTRVIVMGTEKDRKALIDATKNGACDYVLKPLVPEEVTAKLGRIIREKVMRRQDSNGRAKAHRRGTVESQLDAIADGVEPYVDQRDSHSQTVVAETVAAAQRLGFPDKDIEAWAADRRKSAALKMRNMNWATGQFGPA